MDNYQQPHVNAMSSSMSPNADPKEPSSGPIPISTNPRNSPSIENHYLVGAINKINDRLDNIEQTIAAIKQAVTMHHLDMLSRRAA